jgi:hypothetical protein
MANEHAAEQPAREPSDVKVATTVIGPDQYRIVATATFESAPRRRLGPSVELGKPPRRGPTGTDQRFHVAERRSDQVPSTFQFVMATSILKEEIYERTAEEGAGRYRLRSRVLEPALDVLEYDAVLELQRIPGAHTAYSAAREVRLAWCGAGHASRNGRVRDPVSQGILRD